MSGDDWAEVTALLFKDAGFTTGRKSFWRMQLLTNTSRSKFHDSLTVRRPPRRADTDAGTDENNYYKGTSTRIQR